MLINKERAYQIMQKHAVEAIVATTPENVTYLTDFMNLDHRLLRGVQNYAIFTSSHDRDPLLIISIGDVNLAADQKDCWIEDFVTYGTFYVECPPGADLSNAEQCFQRLLTSSKHKKDAVTALVEGLADMGLRKGRVAVDELNITPKLYRTIEQQLPDVEFVEGFQMLREIRAVKTPEEVDRLERSAEIAEMGTKKALEVIGEGVTEFEIGRAVFRKMVEEGALPSWTMVGAGRRSGFADVVPSKYVVHRGDLIRFDVGCTYRCYNSDTARIAVLGEWNQKQRSYYDAIKAGADRALELVRPGVRASEIFEEAVKRVREAGIPRYRRSHMGHGIGIEPYETPLLSPTCDTILEEGMVLNVEAPYYELGFGGVQVEDTVVLTENGCRFLTKSDRDLFVV